MHIVVKKIDNNRSNKEFKNIKNKTVILIKHIDVGIKQHKKLIALKIINYY